MKTWERWSFGMLSLIVAVSGFAYFWMRYFVVSDDPFAVVNHPWQGGMMHVHVLSAPPLILIFGLILNSHIMKKLAALKVPNRRSGIASLATFGLMTATGYLLQVVSAEMWLKGLVAVHVASGAVFSVTYVAHLLISVRLTRTRPLAAVRDVA